MYATIDDVKWFVWSKYSDEKIQMLLDATESDITSVVWDITLGEKTEQFGWCDVWEKSLWFQNTMIREIYKVDGKEYEHWYSILEPQYRRVVFEDLYRYVDENKDYFRISYLSGYESIPEDLKLAHALIVSNDISTLWVWQIESYSMWPRKIKYRNTSTTPYMDKANKILNRYRKFEL